MQDLYSRRALFDPYQARVPQLQNAESVVVERPEKDMAPPCPAAAAWATYTEPGGLTAERIGGMKETGGGLRLSAGSFALRPYGVERRRLGADGSGACARTRRALGMGPRTRLAVRCNPACSA
jgi:hypothetical protein